MPFKLTLFFDRKCQLKGHTTVLIIIIIQDYGSTHEDLKCGSFGTCSIYRWREDEAPSPCCNLDLQVCGRSADYCLCPNCINYEEFLSEYLTLAQRLSSPYATSAFGTIVVPILFIIFALYTIFTLRLIHCS